jgi:hypothetical protein
MAGLPLPESDVLAPRDERISSDEWPDYDLHNVHVHPVDAPTETTSLLRASEHYPLRVTGEVQLHAIPKTYPDPVLKNPGRTAGIVLEEVRSFAYGEYETGGIAIWAAGKAGWFTLKPSRAYRPVYLEMVEAIRMLYFVADAYREERTSGKGKTAKVEEPYSPAELFEKYALDVLGKEDASEQAEEKIYQHRDFLLASMIAGKEGMDWTKNPLFDHLQKTFPTEYEAVRLRVMGKKGAAPRQRARKQSMDSSSTTSSLKRKRGRPPKDGAVRQPDVVSITSSSAASAGSKKAAPRSQRAPSEKSSGSRRTRQNASAPIGERLEDASQEGAAEEAEPQEQTTPIAGVSESDEDEHVARKGKSALRLKPSKASKGAGKGGKGKAPPGPGLDQNGDEADDDDELAMPSSPIRPAGKRKHNSDQDAALQPKRRPSKPSAFDEGIDIPSSPNSTSNSADSPPEATTDAGASTSLPLHPKNSAHVPDPAGQEDTWVCALDGCTHKVYLASRRESQRLIREHYALHAYDDDERVKLIQKLKQPSLPVSHLMDRVRVQARLEGFPGSGVAGTRFPEPVVGRRY